MSETFIKIDSLQRLEISRQTYPTNRSKIIIVTTFTVLCKTLTTLTLKCTSHGYMYFFLVEFKHTKFFTSLIRRLFAKQQTLSS